jgi:hypothetical protein
MKDCPYCGHRILTPEQFNAGDRLVTIPSEVIHKALFPNDSGGRWLEYPVQVNWPMLRLSESQILHNAAAHANGQRDVWRDPSIFSVRMEMITP